MVSKFQAQLRGTASLHLASTGCSWAPLLPLGPANRFKGSEQILPHHILGDLSDFKRIALARGNTQVCWY